MISKIDKLSKDTCLSEAELADYVRAIALNEDVGNHVSEHLSLCDSCFSMVASAVSALNTLKDEPKSSKNLRSSKKAKSIPSKVNRREMMKQFFKKNRYLFVAAVFFVLSFLFDKHFLQFLVAAAVFGLKWTMDTGGTKALIMIYETWRKREKSKDLDDTISRF